MQKSYAVQTSGAIISIILLAGCAGSAHNKVPKFSMHAPDAACNSLAGLKIPVDEIGLPTSGGEIVSAIYNASTALTPAHCLVEGRINSLDKKAQPIQFRAALPDNWRQRMLHQGGGGFDGRLPNVTGESTAGVSPLARGYVFFGSDGGHSAAVTPGGSFALNDEELRNYAGDHIKKTRDAVHYVIRARYAAAPKAAYFIGGSNGGRQGLRAAQRYPTDYNGIISYYPAHSFTTLFLKFHEIGQIQHVNGSVGFIDFDKAKVVLDAQIAACDGLDGLRDGLISNVSACSFNPETLRCPGGADTGPSCLSDAQLKTAAIIAKRSTYGLPLTNSVDTMSGFPAGTLFPSQLYPLGQAAYSQPPTAEQLGTGGNLGDQYMRYFIMRDAKADVLSVNPYDAPKYRDRLIEMSRLIDNASVTDMKQFIDGGGKLLLIHGQADQLIPAQSSIDYYDRLVGQFGKSAVSSFMRFYLLPGYAHGDGLFLPRISTLDAIEQWAEQGKAPSDLTMTDMLPANGNRARPLCEYPTWPKYVGNGDPNAASSFVCVAS